MILRRKKFSVNIISTFYNSIFYSYVLWENQYLLNMTDLLTMNVSQVPTNESYICEQTTSEFEMDKTFECYVVKKTDYVEDQRYTTRYYLSSEVGSNPVRFDLEYNDQNILSLRLTSYNAGQLKDNTENNKTPGFELILLICAITLIFFLKQKKEKCRFIVTLKKN